MFLPIWAIIVIILASGVIGAFIYRNNRIEYDPYADKVDVIWDKLEAKLEEKFEELKRRNDTIL